MHPGNQTDKPDSTSDTLPADAPPQPHETVLSHALFAGGHHPVASIAGASTIAAFALPAEGVPVASDTLTQELSALLETVGVYDLGWLTRLRMVGDDRVRWLNGMVTNSIKALADHTSLYTFLLNAQGRIQGDGDVYALPGALLLITDREQAPRLQAHLDRFIIMDDVELSVDTSATALGLGGPRAETLLQTLLGMPPLAPRQIYTCDSPLGPMLISRGDADQYTLWLADDQVLTLWQQLVSAGALPCGLQAVEALRILAGIPRYGADIHEKSLAQETGQTRALNFNKGCYLGQEIVERVRSRATLNRSLSCFQLTGGPPSPGTALFAPAQPQTVIGELTSIADVSLPRFPHLSGIFALGIARAEAAVTPLGYAQGTATQLRQPPLVQDRKDSTHG
jgi:folate-binding protein YgfZ